MTREPHIPRKRWFAAGAAIIAFATALVAFALYFTVSQPRTVAFLRIAGAQHEAVQLKLSATGHIRYVATRLLSHALTAYQTGRRDPPPRQDDDPRWLGDLYVLDKQQMMRWPGGVDEAAGVDPEFTELVEMRLRDVLGEAGAPDHEPMGFVKDVYHDQPIVLAYTVSGGPPSRPVLVAVRIDLDALKHDYLDLHFGVSGKLRVVRRDDPRDTYWSEPLSDWLPFVIAPARDFVEGELLAANVQRATFIAIALVFVLVLVFLVWKFLRLVEREVALSRLKSNFVADVSHELKTPLALIRMFSEMLSDGRVPSEEKKREYYGIITRESTRLTQLIENILDFSRIEAGQKLYRLEPTDVGRVIRATYDTYRIELDAQGFEHRLTLAEDLPPVNADADAIAQAIVNLMSNAMKYSVQEKRFEIDVERETRRGANGVLISVKDSGIGISPEDRAHLFDGFFRAADDRVRKVRGTGLGLSVVRHIVDAHGGSIDVESRLVKGSVFRIFLPEAAASTSAAARPNARA